MEKINKLGPNKTERQLEEYIEELEDLEVLQKLNLLDSDSQIRMNYLNEELAKELC